ncbi:MAG: hypothetical protein WC485_00255 [Opitutaceae bacterium]
MAIHNANDGTIKIRLDWRAYFLRFCQAHGEPVMHAGRLLFSDGWQYSATDYAGPEWPPAESPSELATRKHAYWSIRHENARQRLLYAERRLTGLQRWQDAKSLPLQQAFRQSDEAGMAHTVSTDIDLDTLTQQVELFRQELHDCESALTELSETPPTIHKGE